MIAVESTAKIGKSPKKPAVEFREDSEDEERETEEESDGSVAESEEYELESADEGHGEDKSEEEEVRSEMEEDGSDTQDSKAEGNPGWADAMQKILRTKKPKRKKTVVLSKAKKLCDVVKKEKEEPSFEIDGVKEEIKTEEVKAEPSTQKPVERKHRRKDNLGIRVKPSINDRERERLLQKIATKGVVQLFNAVKQQQAEINRKLVNAGPLERKREQVLKSIDKRAFLDVLMGESKSVQVDNAVKEETQKDDANKKKKDDKVWSVLRDDFVMGAKLKDWDRQNAEEDSSAPEDMDSDE